MNRDVPGSSASGSASDPDGYAAPRKKRVPFAVLILGLIGGGLCLLLGLNTATAATQVRQRKVDAAYATLSDREQQLSRDVSALQAPGELAIKAAALGLVPADSPAILRIGSDGAVVVLGKAAPATTQPPPVAPRPTTAAPTTAPTTAAPTTKAATAQSTTTTKPGSVSPSSAAKPTPTPKPTKTPTPTITLPGGPR